MPDGHCLDLVVPECTTVYTVVQKPPAVDDCSALPVKHTVPGTAGDITPYKMAEVHLEILNYRGTRWDMRMKHKLRESFK